jgi:hypothetical protein
VPLGYLWQHTWQVGGTVFGAVVMAWMAYALVRGEIPESGWGASTARVFALGGLLLGAGVVVAAWTLNAEPPCGNCQHDHWGGVFGIVVLVIWVGGMVAITTHNIRRERQRLRRLRERP